MIRLGQKVRDVVSGASGVAIARTEWLYGCLRITFQPPLDKDGKPCDSICVDEEQLEVLDQDPILRKLSVPATATGGGGRPDPALPRADSR
jgi:hypothetical protein